LTAVSRLGDDSGSIGPALETDFPKPYEIFNLSS